MQRCVTGVRDRLRPRLFGDGWRAVVRGFGLGVLLAVPVFLFGRMEPRGFFLWIAFLGLCAVLLVRFVRAGAGLVTGLVTGVPALALAVREMHECRPIRGPAVAACVGPPQPELIVSEAAAVALVLTFASVPVSELVAAIHRRLDGARPSIRADR